MANLRNQFIVFTTIILLIGIFFWPVSKIGDSPKLHFSNFGIERNQGNIVGIQPWLDTRHYQSPNVFHEHLRTYFQAAKDKGWLKSNSLVLLPEHLGTWLVASEQTGWVYSAKTTQTALSFIISKSIFTFIQYYFNEQASDPIAASIFKMRSEYMARHYQSIFESLAQEFDVTIIAGSVALQNPVVKDGLLLTTDGPIYNTSAVFTPQGIEQQLIKKVFPIIDEQPFTAAATTDELPTYTSSAGPFSVLICADSWFNQSYEHTSKSHSNIVLVPSFLTGSWTAPWNGYSGYENPDDIDLKDIGTITEGEAWLKYALAGKAKKWGVNFAMNIFLRGELWDLNDSGNPIIWHKDIGLKSGEDYDGPQLINLWL